jgi:hypothetical protein
MKVLTLSFFLVSISIFTQAQVTFQKGYIVTSDGEKKECFIRNYDWVHNPESIEYRFTIDGENLRGHVSNLHAFQVDGFPMYLKANVDIDTSPTKFNSLNTEKNPVWQKKELFLKMLVSGKAALYSFSEAGSSAKFFYRIGDQPVKQLVYKEYLDREQERFIRENRFFLQQLKVGLDCTPLPDNKLKDIKYMEKDLIIFFNRENECNGTRTVKSEPEDKTGRKKFNLTLTPGVTLSSFKVRNSDARYFDRAFAEKNTFRFGAEAESVFGFARNKWSVFIEPSFDYYKSSAGSNSVRYSAIELPIGVRHYFYLKNDFSVFVNGILVPSMRIQLNDELDVRNEFEDVAAGASWACGIGLSKARFKAEARYYASLDVLAKYTSWFTEYKRTSLIFGYRLVKK